VKKHTVKVECTLAHKSAKTTLQTCVVLGIENRKCLDITQSIGVTTEKMIPETSPINLLLTTGHVKSYTQLK
jgi:hypothetical protein